MSYIDKITNKDTGESRVISPSAEAVRVSNDNYEGENLDEVLDEVAHAIEDAGSGDGTVTGVKIGSTTYDPTDGVVDLSSPMSNKVDKETGKGLSTNDYTTADKTKLGSLPTNPVQTISVNGGTPATPVNGNVDISVEGAAGQDGITPHIGSNGNWWIGETDTNIKAQGPMGSVTITDGDIDTLEVHNALNAYTGLLGMSGAMKMKSNIDAVQANLVKLYSKLANMAFWDASDQAAAAPTALDWSLPKHSVAITNNLANSSITRNGESVGNSFQAEEGSTVTLIVAPSGSSYALTNVTYSKDSGSPTSATSLGDGTYKIEFVMGDSDVTISVSGTVVESVAVSLSNADGKLELSPLTCVKNGTYSGTLAVKSGETDYGLPSTISATIGGVAVDFTASGNSYNPSDGSITIANVSGALVITAAATYSGWNVAPKSDTAEVYGIQYGHTVKAQDTTHPEESGKVVRDDTGKTILCPRCNVDPVQRLLGEPAGDRPQNFYAANGSTFQLKMKPLESGCYALNVASYASDYSYISRDSYVDVGANENWETSFNLPANTAYVKVLVCRRDSYGGTVQEMQTIYNNWDNTTMKYK